MSSCMKFECLSNFRVNCLFSIFSSTCETICIVLPQEINDKDKENKDKYSVLLILKRSKQVMGLLNRHQKGHRTKKMPTPIYRGKNKGNETKQERKRKTHTRTNKPRGVIYCKTCVTIFVSLFLLAFFFKKKKFSAFMTGIHKMHDSRKRKSNSKKGRQNHHSIYFFNCSLSTSYMKSKYGLSKWWTRT